MEKIVAFVNGGHYAPASPGQMKIVAEFFVTVQTAIEIGADRLGLVHSKIIEGEFWLKNLDGGYHVINPDPEVQTVVFASDEMVKSPNNIGILEEQVLQVTIDLRKKIEALA